MNTNTVNKIAEATVRLTSRTANLAVMQALTDSWNTLTDQQRADFTSNVGDYNTVTVAISMGWAAPAPASTPTNGMKKSKKITPLSPNT